MENASKALLMAAGVLIGVLILSLAIYLFSNFGSTSAEVHRQKEIQDINEFNTQFTSYEGKECTIHDIITVTDLAVNNNDNYSLTDNSSNNYYISVNIKNRAPNLQIGFNANKANDLIKYDEQHMITTKDKDGVEYQVLPKYTCDVQINENTKRVKKIIFTKK